MPKHRKSRKLMRRKNQKGGLFGFWESTSDPTAPKQSWSEWWSGSSSSLANGAENMVESGANAVSSGLSSASNSVEGFLSTDINLTGSNANANGNAEYNSQQNNPMGGKRRHRMRGGKGGLGLTYYASPVHGANVAEPTYWIKGGSKRRGSKKSRKSRKKRR